MLIKMTKNRNMFERSSTQQIIMPFFKTLLVRSSHDVLTRSDNKLLAYYQRTLPCDGLQNNLQQLERLSNGRSRAFGKSGAGRGRNATRKEEDKVMRVRAWCPDQTAGREKSTKRRATENTLRIHGATKVPSDTHAGMSVCFSDVVLGIRWMKWCSQLVLQKLDMAQQVLSAAGLRASSCRLYAFSQGLPEITVYFLPVLGEGEQMRA